MIHPLDGALVFRFEIFAQSFEEREHLVVLLKQLIEVLHALSSRSIDSFAF